jgi:hypothetical protein
VSRSQQRIPAADAIASKHERQSCRLNDACSRPSALDASSSFRRRLPGPLHASRSADESDVRLDMNDAKTLSRRPSPLQVPDLVLLCNDLFDQLHQPLRGEAERASPVVSHAIIVRKRAIRALV